MRIIGLTGGIACGKTTVSRYISSCGIPVVDGDLLSRELTAPGSPVLLEIRDVFGVRYLNDNGSLNRRALGRLVFENAEARQRLDDIMAPHLMALTRARIEEHRRQGVPACVLDMPLLFEKGYDSLCDTVWTVWLPQREQLSRLMSRDGYTESEAMARILAVMSSDEKASRSDQVIDNSGSVQHTIDQVSALLNAVLNEDRKPAVPAPPPAYTQYPVRSDPAQPPSFETMERPRAARRSAPVRKVSWRMPAWLMALLISTAVLLILSVTAYSLMSGYLRRQAEQHAREQQWIDDHYPLPDDKIMALVTKYADEYNLEKPFVLSVILNESSFNPDAVSPVGAIGLMQLMPDTAEWIAEKLKVSGFAPARMYDPESNIRFGCWYLNYLSGLFSGNPVCVISAYHAGQGQVKIWLSDPSRSPDGLVLTLESLPDGPTRTYAERVMRDYGIYQQKYFTPDLPDLAGRCADPG